MKTSKLKTGFSRMSDSQLQEHSLAVVAAITGNAHFPEPLPLLATLTDTVNAYSDALSLAKSRDKVKVAIKNNERNRLETVLRKTADYCGFIAEGDRAILASTGFYLNTEINAFRALSYPENFTVQLGDNPGEVIVSVNKVANAQAYILYYAQAGDNPAWEHVTSSQTIFNLTDLETLKLYSFKISVIGRKGQLLQTETITKPVV